MTTTFQDLSNYEKLIKTAETLRHSQGYYARLYEGLLDISDEAMEDINNIETLYSARDTLDVVMYLEG